eukprot:gene2437-biopygen1963
MKTARATCATWSATGPISHEPRRYGALPAFLMFAASGRLDCFAACLTTPAPIDFTRGYLQWSITGNSGEEIVFRPSVLFVLCLAKGKEEASIIFNAIAKRLKKNVPGDAVEWEKGFRPSGAYNFLSHVADNQLLHVIWPIVKGLDYFAEKKDPIPIYSAASEGDWKQLSRSDQKRFDLRNGFRDASTDALQQLCHAHPPDVAEVRQCVAAGARITRLSVFSAYPLGFFIINRYPECVAACMETPHSIDFTMDEKGRNVCISICKYAHTPQEAEALLKPVVKRIAENRPGDKVDWEQRNHLGYNFFSYAAEFDLLHVVWPIVKPLPYFKGR